MSTGREDFGRKFPSWAEWSSNDPDDRPVIENRRDPSPSKQDKTLAPRGPAGERDEHQPKGK